MTTTPDQTTARRAPRLPPRWFILGAWYGHRALLRASGGRLGLRTPGADGRFGMLRLRTTGRRSGRERIAILGYHQDGENLVTLAMNGWGEGAPAWWLNLLADPDAIVDLKGAAARPIHARAAVGEERERIWALLHGDPAYGGNLDDFEALRSTETPVVVLEPRSAIL